jgi:hypothetical protein
MHQSSMHQTHACTQALQQSLTWQSALQGLGYCTRVAGSHTGSNVLSHQQPALHLMGPLVVLLVMARTWLLPLSAEGAGAVANSWSHALALVVISHTASPVDALTPAEFADAARAQLASRTRSVHAGRATWPLLVLLAPVAVVLSELAAGCARHCVTVRTSGTHTSMLVSWPIFRSVFSRTSSVKSRMQLLRVADRVVA